MAHRSTGTGDRDRSGDRVLGFSKCRHDQLWVGEDEDWGEGSGDEDEREEGYDDVIEVESSGSRDSVNPILRLPERNEEDTAWTRADGTNPVSAKNKLKSEDMATVRKHKDLLWTEVAKNDQDSLVDRWWRDQIKLTTWDKIVQVLPQQASV